MRGAGPFAAFFVAACIASCSLLSDFDNVAGVRPPDAGEDAVEVAEGGDTSVDGSAPFTCLDGKKLVCTSFDEGAVDRGGWKIEVAPGGTVQLDATQFTSPPASFHSKIPSLAKGESLGAIISQKLSVGPFTTLFYGFDMRILSCASEGNGGSVTLAVLQPSRTLLGIVLIDTNLVSFARLPQGGVFTPTPMSPQPGKDWIRVEMRVSTTASSAHARVTLGASVVFDDDIEPGAPFATVTLNLGANGSGPVKGCDVVYDNVAFGKE